MSVTVTLTNCKIGNASSIPAAKVISGVSQVLFRPDTQELVLYTGSAVGGATPDSPFMVIDTSGTTTSTLTGLGTTAYVLTIS